MSKLSTFGELLDSYLYREDRSASWLADKMGVTRSTVTRWQKNETKPNSHDKIISIGCLLHLNSLETNSLLISCDFQPTQVEKPTVAQESGQQIHPIVQNAVNDLSSANPEIRASAIETLKTTDHPSALFALMESTKHPTVDVRRAIMKALQSYNEEKIFETFENGAVDADIQVRKLAIEGLQSSNLSSSFNVVLLALNDSSYEVVVAALETLLNTQYQFNSGLVHCN